jgi:hypothetical protein
MSAVRTGALSEGDVVGPFYAIHRCGTVAPVIEQGENGLRPLSHSVESLLGSEAASESTPRNVKQSKGR